jgi:hypothetical protein
MFRRGEVVVVEQLARWPAATDLAEPSQLRVASAFLVRDGRVTRVARFADVDSALASVGLDRSSEII